MNYHSRKILRISLLTVLSVLLCSCDEDYTIWTEQQKAQEVQEESSSSTEEQNSGPVVTKSPDLNTLDLIDSISSAPEVPLTFPLDTLKQYDNCPALLLGTPRGLSCLHCTQPQAKEQARIIASLLFNSCLKNIAINYLVDGTFSYDPYVLKEHIDLLTSNNRTPFIFFYLSNGATQRQWDRATVDSFGVRMKPEEFRKRILTDIALQDEYRSIIARLLPLVQYAIQKGAVVSLIPSLEDNLDDTSFQKLFDIILEMLPPGLPVSAGRNPCPSCYPGNTSGAPYGLFIEEHTINPVPRITDGVISNDGREYHFDEYSSSTQRKLRLEDLAPLRDNSSLSNNVFILWSGKRQGLHNYIPGTTTYPEPSQRSYSKPGLSEQAAILRFLRENFN